MKLLVLTQQASNHNVGYILIACAIIALLGGLAMSFAYHIKVKRDIDKKKSGFETTKKGRYQIYNFWGHYVYIFIAVVCFIAFILALGIGIGTFF